MKEIKLDPKTLFPLTGGRLVDIKEDNGVILGLFGHDLAPLDPTDYHVVQKYDESKPRITKIRLFELDDSQLIDKFDMYNGFVFVFFTDYRKYMCRIWHWPSNRKVCDWDLTFLLPAIQSIQGFNVFYPFLSITDVSTMYAFDLQKILTDPIPEQMQVKGRTVYLTKMESEPAYIEKTLWKNKKRREIYGFDGPFAWKDALYVIAQGRYLYSVPRKYSNEPFQFQFEITPEPEISQPVGYQNFLIYKAGGFLCKWDLETRKEVARMQLQQGENIERIKVFQNYGFAWDYHSDPVRRGVHTNYLKIIDIPHFEELRRFTLENREVTSIFLHETNLILGLRTSSTEEYTVVDLKEILS